VADDSDAMVVLTHLANGSGNDPREHFASMLAEVGHLTVSFKEGNDEMQLSLPELSLMCVPEPGPGGERNHLGLRVAAVKPNKDHPDGAKLLTVTMRDRVVTSGNGVTSDTHRIVDWHVATDKAASSAELYAALKLVDSLENAEKQRASIQRTKFVAAREFWRCKNCRALWRPADHSSCPSCGREFTDADFKQHEVGKVEFTVPADMPITLAADAAVLVEPEDEVNFVGRVSRIDQRRHIVEVTCKTRDAVGTEGWIAPSFNRALYQAKRSVLAAIATRDFGVGLIAQLLVAPELVSVPEYQKPETTQEWLTDGMSANPPQDRAVALLSNLRAGESTFIQGPPGTGKTTVIVEAIKRRLAANPEERILVTSHSNLAVDNALERLDGTPNMEAVRVARAERIHSSVDKFRCDDEDDPRLMTANCYFATCATAATSALTDMNFDLVILDEANKARVDEALPALRLGAALALVGDHKQLPPVEDDALYGIVETDPALEELVNRSLFEQAWEGGLPEAAKCLLTIQHRMHPQISSYVSNASYDGLLEDAQKVKDYDFITRYPFGVALHFVDTEGMRGGRERRGPGGALRNEAEVRVAAQVIRLLDERAPAGMTMAVIAMYAEQVERLRQALGRKNFKRPVKIDTVDSFEGREEDIVVISLVRSNERGRIGFLRVPNRLNVAISRAKRLVACIGDSATLRSGEESMYGALVEAARQAGGWLPATDIVKPARRRRRGRSSYAEGEPRQQPQPQAQEGEGGEQRRRRRRRRRRGNGPQFWLDPQGQPQLGPNGQPLLRPKRPKPVAVEVGTGDPEHRRKRRRRRRRGPRPFDAVSGEPTIHAAPANGSGPMHFGPDAEVRSYRPRRTEPPSPPVEDSGEPPVAATGS